MIASGVFAGVYDLEFGLACTDIDGHTVGGELARIGYAGDEACGGRPIAAFFETHIEQGPILEAEDKTIGVVLGAQGLRWYDVTVTGMESHAGSTPMARRRDALLAAARMVDAINRVALAHPPGVATVGELRSAPNSRNVIPGEVFFTIDARHPDAVELAAIDRELRDACESIARDAGVEIELRQVSHTPPVVFDADCAAAVRRAAEEAGFAHRDIVSGAGHDACHINQVAPTAMIFVPCADGISHNETESATPEDLAAGCNVLLRAMLSRADH